MAPPAQRPRPLPDDPPLDSGEAVDRAYHLHRAKRHARNEHRRTTRRARLRFWAVLLVLGAASVVLVLLVWREIQSLFGL